MSVTLNQRDWLAVSAYLDGQMKNAEKAILEARLESETALKTALQEIEYTRRLLRELPQRRAPRNFTLSAQYSKKRSLKWGLNHFFGLTSAASAIALAAIFAWTNTFGFQTKLSAPAPMMAAVPEAAVESAALTDQAESQPPMIIVWGQPNQAYGLGGSGGGSDASEMTAKDMGGYGGGGEPETVYKNDFPAATESPLMSANPETATDPSTLILGLPEQSSESETIQREMAEPPSPQLRFSASTIWMIALGAASLLFALLAIFFHRR